MRLWYFSASRIPSRAANSVHVIRMAEAFGEIGVDLTLFSARGDDRIADIEAYYGIARGRFSLVRLPRPRIRVAGALVLARRMVQAAARLPLPDAFYGRNPFALAMAARRWPGKPFAYEAHALPQSALHARLEHWLLRQKGCCGLVAISEGLAADYRSRMKTLLEPAQGRRRVHVLHDGATLPAGPGMEPMPWPGRTDALQIGFVGSLFEGKGADMLVRLARIVPDMDFHIVGGAPADIARLNPRPRLSNLWFHGHQPPSSLSAYYGRFDVVLAPLSRRVALEGGGGDISRWTSPLKVFEALAHSRPLVASDLPVIREVLQDGVTALLVPPDDVVAWRAALERLRDTRLRARIASAGHERLREHYTWVHRARAIRGLLERRDNEWPANAPVG
ncbi:MAG TPA: glycosyltransferase family 4 protein [Hyphomicrobiaceae bacterium]|nr:glycosyltransferase family 4 protein [Hyphomicrobiaceae bacterium]